eukprot:SAG22_NODE_28_length_28728_cov_19.603619_20_plen_148_part_00
MPLAPALALVNNLFEIRGDAQNLCTYQRRLIYKEAEDIGSWMTVFSTYSALSVVTNVLLICFSSTAVAGPLVAAGSEPLSIYTNIGQRYQSYDLWIVFLLLGKCARPRTRHPALAPAHTCSSIYERGWARQADANAQQTQTHNRQDL